MLLLLLVMAQPMQTLVSEHLHLQVAGQLRRLDWSSCQECLHNNPTCWQQLQGPDMADTRSKWMGTNKADLQSEADTWSWQQMEADTMSMEQKEADTTSKTMHKTDTEKMTKVEQDIEKTKEEHTAKKQQQQEQQQEVADTSLVWSWRALRTDRDWREAESEPRTDTDWWCRRRCRERCLWRRADAVAQESRIRTVLPVASWCEASRTDAKTRLLHLHQMALERARRFSAAAPKLFRHFACYASKEEE